MDDDNNYDNIPLQRFLENTIKARPEFELRTMLSLHKSESLKKLARLYRMKRYASAKKSQMVEHLYSALTDSEHIESMLLLSDDDEYSFFEEVVKQEKAEMKASEASSKPYYYYRKLYFLEIYNMSGRISFVVPDTVKDIYFRLCNTSFPETRNCYGAANSFATAFANIYGVVDVDYFTEFINCRLQKKIEDIKLINILEGFIWVRNATYNIFGDLLIHSELDKHTIETEIGDYLVEASNDEVYKIESERDCVPMKPLPPEEILKYTDPNYFEITQAHEDLACFMEEHDPEIKNTPILSIINLRELNKILRQTDDHNYSIPYFDTRKFEADENAMKTMNNLIDGVNKHTRKWSKNGWMPIELEMPPG